MTFRVGQKVSMVGKKSSYAMEFGCDGWPSCINTGGVYTVRDVDTRAAAFGWPILLRFEEFVAEPWPVEGFGMWEPGFPGDCFRPIVENRKRVAFTMGADPESERWDNRKKKNERV